MRTSIVAWLLLLSLLANGFQALFLWGMDENNKDLCRSLIEDQKLLVKAFAEIRRLQNEYE